MLFRCREHMHSEKMPDSPDPLAKVKISVANGMPVPLDAHKANVTLNLNGSRSPPSQVRDSTPPSPKMNANAMNATSSSTTNPSSSNQQRNDGTNGMSKSRQIIRVKRFLSTLQHLAADISAETGERVRSLIQGVVSSIIPIEEFLQKIEEVTNYPMRPFAISFLKSHLPLLQTEVCHFSRLSKQSPQQYLKYHDHFLMDSAPTSASQGKPPEAFDIFLPDVKENGKKRALSCRIPKNTGEFDDLNGDCHPPSKRHQSIPSPTMSQRVSPAAPASSYLPPGMNFRVDEPAHVYRESRYDRFDRYDRDFYRPYYGAVPRDYVEDRDMEEEWRNIHTMLSCILGMVEKTKRALAILQHRSYAERAEMSSWARLGRHLDHDLEHKKTRPSDLVSHYKVAEERVSDVRRRAEDAVSEVKRQAVAELQKAVSAAETKANELVAAERLKMERLIAEARRQAAEDAITATSHQEESTENCWNCGRKASETCSGCNVARYCGSFCQHKDWENHHRICGQTAASSSSSLSGASSTSTASSRVVAEKCPSPIRGTTTTLLDVKAIKTDV